MTVMVMLVALMCSTAVVHDLVVVAFCPMNEYTSRPSQRKQFVGTKLDVKLLALLDMMMSYNMLP